MARIWYRGDDEHWFIPEAPGLRESLPDAKRFIQDDEIFLQVSEALIAQLRENGREDIVQTLELAKPWMVGPSKKLLQLFFLDGESEIPTDAVAANIVRRMDNDEAINLEDTGYRPLNDEEIDWNRAVWQRRRLLAKAREAAHAPAALDEKMSEWTAADDLYLHASGILYQVLRESYGITTKEGRAYAIHGFQTITLSLTADGGFQIEVKIEERGTSWDYQPQGWLMNTWHTDSDGYHVDTRQAGSDEVEEMLALLGKLSFVCDRATGI